MLAEGVSGPVQAPKGSPQKLTFGDDGGLRTAGVHGDFYDAVSRGNVFTATTAVAGVAPGTSITTSAQARLIFNPPGSGVNLSILETSVGYVSGTIGAGHIAYAIYDTRAPGTNLKPGGTANVPINSLLNVSNSRALVFDAATTTAAGIYLKPAFSIGAIDGTGVVQPMVMIDKVNGLIVVPPGVALIVTGIMAAGTSPKITVGTVWEEVPI